MGEGHRVWHGLEFGFAQGQAWLYFHGLEARATALMATHMSFE